MQQPRQLHSTNWKKLRVAHKTCCRAYQLRGGIGDGGRDQRPFANSLGRVSGSTNGLKGDGQEFEDCESNVSFGFFTFLIFGLSLITLPGIQVSATHPNNLPLHVPAPVSRSFRGSIGNSHIEMNLVIAGDQLSGTYSYDRIRQEIKLTGQINKTGGLEPKEFDAAGKQTGRFTCKGPLGDRFESDCTWSKANGTGESLVLLTEQHVSFTNGVQITAKVLSNRQKGIDVSYPQINGGTGTAVIAAENFNRRMGNLVNRAIKEFEPIDPAGHNRFETNYTVCWAPTIWSASRCMSTTRWRWRPRMIVTGR